MLAFTAACIPRCEHTCCAYPPTFLVKIKNQKAKIKSNSISLPYTCPHYSTSPSTLPAPSSLRLLFSPSPFAPRRSRRILNRSHACARGVSVSSNASLMIFCKDSAGSPRERRQKFVDFNSSEGTANHQFLEESYVSWTVFGVKT
jgi:hypothetical protein